VENEVHVLANGLPDTKRRNRCDFRGCVIGEGTRRALLRRGKTLAPEKLSKDYVETGAGYSLTHKTERVAGS